VPTLVSSTYDRPQKKPEHFSVKAVRMTLRGGQVSIKKRLHWVQAELAFMLNVLTTRLKFYLHRILRIMSRVSHRSRQAGGQWRSHSRRSNSHSRSIFHQ
jgi:hypothetical protein